MMVHDRGLIGARWRIYGDDIPVRAEMFSQDRVVRFANLAVLMAVSEI